MTSDVTDLSPEGVRREGLLSRIAFADEAEEAETYQGVTQIRGVMQLPKGYSSILYPLLPTPLQCAHSTGEVYSYNLPASGLSLSLFSEMEANET